MSDKDRLERIKRDHDEGYCTLDDSAWLISQVEGLYRAMKAKEPKQDHKTQLEKSIEEAQACAQKEN